MLCWFNHAATAGVFDQQLVSTSSPPRCTKLSWNRGSLAPASSSIKPSIKVKVAFEATFRGCRHVLEGQISGYPLHQLAACPGMSNSTITRTPRMRAYSTMEATSACVYLSDSEYAPSQSLGLVFDWNGND